MGAVGAKVRVRSTSMTISDTDAEKREEDDYGGSDRQSAEQYTRSSSSNFDSALASLEQNGNMTNHGEEEREHIGREPEESEYLGPDLGGNFSLQAFEKALMKA